MNSYQLICNILTENTSRSPLGSDQTNFSKDPEKAKEEKRFLTKLTIIGTSVGVGISSWQLLRNPALRKQVIDSIKQRNPKLLWSLYGFPIAAGVAADMVSQPVIGWAANRWQDSENKRRLKNERV
jgi:hypothetical protein